MKGLLAFYKILAIFVLITIFASCSADQGNVESPKVYESMIIDKANDMVSMNVYVEIDEYWTGTSFKEENMKDMSCNIGDDQYIGKYARSIIKLKNSYITDIYRDPSFVEFGLRRDTGELVSINFMNRNFFDTEPYLDDVQEPRETALKIADETAKLFVNVAEYERIVADPQKSEREKDGTIYEMTYYKVNYERKVDNLNTSDWISITVTSKGNLASLSMGDINAFSNIDISNMSSVIDDIIVSVTSKVLDVYDMIGYDVVEQQIDKQTLVITPDERVGVFSTITVQVKDSFGEEYNTGISVITFLEK